MGTPKPKQIDVRVMRDVLAGLLQDIDDGKLVLDEAQKIPHGDGSFTFAIGASPNPHHGKGKK